MDYESIEIRFAWLDGEFEMHITSTFWLVLDVYISLTIPEIYLGIPIKECDGGLFRYTGKDHKIHFHKFRPDDSIFWREKLITVNEPESEDLIPF